ncbi:MAG: RrF2 family transcriptional regulator [Desulfatiglandales bacterium]
MLRLSTKARYGVRAMYEIALKYPGPITIKEISENQGLSVPYLEQILNKLKNVGLLIPIKGPGGGYILSRNPEDISVVEILNELEGPFALTSCLNPEEGCMRIEGCVMHLLWKKLSEHIQTFLKTITLKDLVALGRELKGGNPNDKSKVRRKR